MGAIDRAASIIAVLAVMMVAVLVSTVPAAANFCTGNYIDQVHRDEARELENKRYSNGNNCSAGSTTCYIGDREYNTQVIACSRKRDVKPFKLGPINDVPGIHKGAGKHLDDRTAGERNFARNLSAKMISGQMQYFGLAPKWYGYILEREKGDWIVTTILDFKFPNAEKQVIHLPIYLLSRLSTTQGGSSLNATVCGQNSSGNKDEGLVIVDWGSGSFARACRVNRDRQLYLLDDGDRTDQDFIDEGLGFTRSRTALDWLMHHWRAVIEQVWSRPDGSFQVKVEIANFAGQPGEIDEEDVDLFRKNDVVYEVELHHNQGRANNMFRPIQIGVKIYKAIYAGLYPAGVAHEFGHSLGLDDEYPNRSNPKDDRNCHLMTGYLNKAGDGADKANRHRAYAMCDDWDLDYTYTPSYINQHTVKSVYPWILTQRYAIGEEIKGCKEDDQCLGGQYCKKTPLLTNRCTDKKAQGSNCTADKQCKGKAVCKPKPFGKCIIEGSKLIGEACFNNPECATGKCNLGQCVCGDDPDCPKSDYCDKGGIAGIGANSCRPLKAIGEGCTRAGQCATGRCYVGQCKPKDECSDDSDCAGNNYCDKGTLTLGVNQCVRKKALDQNCSRAGQCRSNRCYIGKCKPQDECSNDSDCAGNNYCDKGTLTVGVNQCVRKKALDQSCTRAGQCRSDRCYIGKCKPQDECSNDSDCAGNNYCDKGTLTVGVNQCVAKKPNNAGCTRASQCSSGRCYAGQCKPQDECAQDSDCSGSKYCDKGTLTVGVNQCVAKKSNGQGCTRKEQCASGRCNVGFCAEEKECSKDSDCIDNRYCDKGTAGIGKNECKRKKSLGDACSRGGQCFSNCCKLHNFKVQCRPTNKC